ncbi:Hypothetical predicted protein [Podarcis lilfordi]|uniref:Uncharacterized protein n=1 Tax=Podarcis lilfordi TaxID=74358 RepID=A0AA35KNJ4_9SAUR|nr:Hypothetical predicted protein [Podarcis lilfordi]
MNASQEEGDQGGGGGGIHCAWAAAKAPLRGWEEAGSSCRDCGEPGGVAQAHLCKESVAAACSLPLPDMFLFGWLGMNQQAGMLHF